MTAGLEAATELVLAIIAGAGISALASSLITRKDSRRVSHRRTPSHPPNPHPGTGPGDTVHGSVSVALPPGALYPSTGPGSVSWSTGPSGVTWTTPGPPLRSGLTPSQYWGTLSAWTAANSTAPSVPSNSTNPGQSIGYWMANGGPVPPPPTPRPPGMTPSQYARYGDLARDVAAPNVPDPTAHPILAHRAARLLMHPGGTVQLGAVTSDETFGIHADARCRYAGVPLDVTRFGDLDPRTVYPGAHPVPDLYCTCGFYAVPPDVKAQHDAGTVDLLVELSGLVIEHTEGFRAQHQQVLEIRLRQDCHPTWRAHLEAVFGIPVTVLEGNL